MLKNLITMLSKSPRDDCAKKPARNAAVKPAANGNGAYRAISVVPGGKCCSAAKSIAGRRYLSREAPRLPLELCTMSTGCSCKFKKGLERRGSDRRLNGMTETSRWFAGPENRKRAQRSGRD
jgi:hypothetical protein